MAYLGDSVNGFGDYQKSEYGKNSKPSRIKHINGALGSYVEGPRGYGMGEEEAVADIDEVDNPFEGVDGDAFAGYFSSAANEETIEDIVEDTLSDQAGGLGLYGEHGYDQEMQSWSTHFHKASLAKSEDQLIKDLAKAVAAVPEDTSSEIKQQYYNNAKAMVARKKHTELRHLDVDRVELQSNIGWLVNPNVPKKGGFNALIAQSVGKLGPALGKDSVERQKIKKLESLGRQLKGSLRKANQFGSLSTLTENKAVVYLGLGVAAAAAYYYFNRKSLAFSKKSRSRKKRK